MITMKYNQEVTHSTTNVMKPNHLLTIFALFCNAFKNAVLPETFEPVDEQVAPFKEVHSMKCYLPKKPKKWGYKFWARAGISSYIYDFEVHGGLGSKGAPTGSTAPKACGQSDFVILRDCQKISDQTSMNFYLIIVLGHRSY